MQQLILQLPICLSPERSVRTAPTRSGNLSYSRCARELSAPPTVSCKILHTLEPFQAWPYPAALCQPDWLVRRWEFCGTENTLWVKCGQTATKSLLTTQIPPWWHWVPTWIFLSGARYPHRWQISHWTPLYPCWVRLCSVPWKVPPDTKTLESGDKRSSILQIIKSIVFTAFW